MSDNKGKPVRIEPEIYVRIKAAAERWKMTIGGAIVKVWTAHEKKAGRDA